MEDYSNKWYSEQNAKLQQAVNSLHGQLTESYLVMQKLYKYAHIDNALLSELKWSLEDASDVLCEFDELKQYTQTTHRPRVEV